MDNKLFIKDRNNKLAERTVNSLKKRFFDAYYVSTKKEALQKAIELIPKEDVISWGGSVTIEEIGLLDYIKNNKYHVIDRDTATTPEERNEYLRQSLHCDTYLMGTNAISEDGQLINIDCIGNRIAALMFGPKNVIIVIGINKVMPTIEDALKRARNYAAPVNMQRVSSHRLRQTPCISNGTCSDCISRDSICSNIVRTRLCTPEKRIKVIVVGENLGF